MTTLTDADIRDALSAGAMEIEPFTEGQLTPNGYDLAIAEVVLPDTGHKFVAGTAVVPPLTRFMVSTRERVRLGVDMSAQLWLRTSWARRGVIASFGRIDAGFDGTLTFGAFNSSGDSLEVPLGETFAQMVVEGMTGSAESAYGERSGHYQHQRGVTMATDREGDVGRNPDQGPRVVVAPCLGEGCHECCLDTEMPLSRTDVERLAARGHDPAAFSMTEDGFAFLANVDGRCFFLDGEGRCREYAHRPEGCRLYPLVLDEEMTDFVMDSLCPHAASVSADGADETALMELLDRLAREKLGD
ncbi:MAG: YkgJ family cysteine cluster protein [Thermoplasmata archaeon]|nr:MAG: YkgJ family cysteine cluster protein [Thermoplasmata archaeon]